MQRWRHATRQQLPHRVDHHQRPAVDHRRAVSTFLPSHPTIRQLLGAPIGNRAQRAADSGVDGTPTRPTQRAVEPVDASRAQTRRISRRPSLRRGGTRRFAAPARADLGKTFGPPPIPRPRVVRHSRFAARVRRTAPEGVSRVRARSRHALHHRMPAFRTVRRRVGPHTFRHQRLSRCRTRTA